MAETAAGAPPRRLRAWLVAQLESGRFAGLEWDDAARTALRVPWQHAGKGGSRGGAGTALCRAWAEFKGRLRAGQRPDPAGWKTRLRCALSKSRELQELPARHRPGGPRPYKVYRLLPPPEVQAERGGSRPRKELVAGGGGASRDHAPPPEEPRPAAEEAEPGPAPPPATLRLELDSTEPLPPLQGDACLLLEAWLGGAPAVRHWLPPGEYLLCPAPPGGAGPAPPALLPRLLLRLAPPPGEAPPPPVVLRGLGAGLLLSSAPRGICLRRAGPRGRGRAAGGGACGEGGGAAGGEGEEGGGVSCRAPHAPPGRLRPAELVAAFDAQRFRHEVAQHRAGLGPRPEHRVTLAVGQELGPHDGPHNRTLVLQLEQAFAQQLLDGAEEAPGLAPLPLDR